MRRYSKNLTWSKATSAEDSMRHMWTRSGLQEPYRGAIWLERDGRWHATIYAMEHKVVPRRTGKDGFDSATKAKAWVRRTAERIGCLAQQRWRWDEGA